jgi:hypothetical protein
MINRRSFIKCLSALPFCGLLKSIGQKDSVPVEWNDSHVTYHHFEGTQNCNVKYTLLDRLKENENDKHYIARMKNMNDIVDDFFMDIPFIESDVPLRHKRIEI